MNNEIHLIMPMGGSGSRFSERGFELPKPLLEINGKPFFYWAAQSIVRFSKLKSLTFVVLQEHIDRFQIDKEIKKYYPNAYIRVLKHVLNGAVLTCLEGVKDIIDDAPILFNDCDHIFTCQSFYDFLSGGNYSEIDGALLTFESNDPKFSFLELDEFGHVIRTVEKKVVSNQAICGAYYFGNRKVFENAVQVYLEECAYNEFFVSGVYNIMSRNKANICNFTVDMHIPFGTPEEYDEAMKFTEFERLI